MKPDLAARLHRAAGVLLNHRSADRVRHRKRAVGWERDPVEPSHDRVRIGHPPVHAGRPGATEQHLPVGDPRARFEENPADVGRFSSEIAGLVGPTGLH